MAKQLCFKCSHNTTGEIKEIDGRELCEFDCNLQVDPVIEDFEKDCDAFEEVNRNEKTQG